MPKFLRKPIVIEARQVPDGSERTKAFRELREWCKGSVAFRTLDPQMRPMLVIDTPEGPMHAICGDWIARGVAGEFYPIKEDIFPRIYEEVQDEVN